MKSYFLMLKASALQGRRQFEAVIDIATRAKELNPKSQMAFLMLADDLIRLHRFDEAKTILEEALAVLPKDYLFNIWYAQILKREDRQLDEIVPYVKRYIDGRPKDKGGFPFYMKGMLKIIGKSDRADSIERDVNNISDENSLWAENILKEYLDQAKAT